MNKSEAVLQSLNALSGTGYEIEEGKVGLSFDEMVAEYRVEIISELSAMLQKKLKSLKGAKLDKGDFSTAMVYSLGDNKELRISLANSNKSAANLLFISRVFDGPKTQSEVSRLIGNAGKFPFKNIVASVVKQVDKI